MNFLQKIKSNLERQFLNRIPDRDIMVEAEMRRGTERSSKLSEEIIIDAKLLRAQNLKIYKNAVAAATDPELPDWQLLNELYDNLLLDNHLRSVIDTRIAFVQQHPFKIIDDQGVENDEMTRLFQRPWFEDLSRIILMTRFVGRSLIELYSINDDQEIEQINLIPQSHFNAQVGIITKYPGDVNGWPYKEPPFSRYYFQVGKDYDLGLLEKMAPIVLAKKLAMGSWQDYIEKYGVPPLFITTDREDDGRLRQLYEAAARFKSNHFMVGRGQEKFEVGQISTPGIAPFDQLIVRVNEEISKAILGGTALTDEKSFVGSSEIQYQLAKNRFESDKLLFKHVFNHQVKPRLINLSPVYAPLEHFHFEWDETEAMDVSKIVDAIQKIGGIYDIDPDYVTEMTGIPIRGFRETPSFAPSAQASDPQKKNGGL